MNESGGGVDRPATRVTHARQHGGDILREQERSNSANVVFKTAPRGKSWRALEHRLYGSLGPASAVRKIDPATGEVVATIPARTPEA
jgi:hypothetical protein